jgi:hypothetical protein
MPSGSDPPLPEFVRVCCKTHQDRHAEIKSSRLHHHRAWMVDTVNWLASCVPVCSKHCSRHVKRDYSTRLCDYLRDELCQSTGSIRVAHERRTMRLPCPSWLADPFLLYPGTTWNTSAYGYKRKSPTYRPIDLRLSRHYPRNIG